jgi:hypothetical protein
MWGESERTAENDLIVAGTGMQKLLRDELKLRNVGLIEERQDVICSGRRLDWRMARRGS